MRHTPKYVSYCSYIPVNCTIFSWLCVFFFFHTSALILFLTVHFYFIFFEEYLCAVDSHGRGIGRRSVLFLYNENKRILIPILPEGDRMVSESGGALHDFLKELSLIILKSRVSVGAG